MKPSICCVSFLEGKRKSRREVQLTRRYLGCSGGSGSGSGSGVKSQSQSSIKNSSSVHLDPVHPVQLVLKPKRLRSAKLPTLNQREEVRG